MPYKIEDWILEEVGTRTSLVVEDEIITHLENTVLSGVGTKSLLQVVTDWSCEGCSVPLSLLNVILQFEVTVSIFNYFYSIYSDFPTIDSHTSR